MKKAIANVVFLAIALSLTGCVVDGGHRDGHEDRDHDEGHDHDHDHDHDQEHHHDHD